MAKTEELDHIAYELFRTWVKNAAVCFPENEFAIVDEMRIVNDFNDALLSALKTLHEENATTRLRAGFDYGFIIGFLTSYLSERWYHEYIIKNTDEYKSFLITKALMIHLMDDEFSNLKVMGIYKKLFEDDLNLAKIDSGLSVEVNQNYSSYIDYDQLSEVKDPIVKSLYNQQLKQITAIVEKDAINFLPDIRMYLRVESILQIIKDYEKEQARKFCDLPEI